MDCGAALGCLAEEMTGGAGLQGQGVGQVEVADDHDREEIGGHLQEAERGVHSAFCRCISPALSSTFKPQGVALTLLLLSTDRLPMVC